MCTMNLVLINSIKNFNLVKIFEERRIKYSCATLFTM